MALSGTFQNYPVSSFGLYCEWSGVQSVTGNYTDITLNVYLSYYTLAVGARSDSTISVNGVSETYTAPRHQRLLQRMEKEAAENQNGAGQPQCGWNKIRGCTVRLLAILRHLFRRIHRNDHRIRHRYPQQHRPHRAYGVLLCFQYHRQRLYDFRFVFGHIGYLAVQSKRRQHLDAVLCHGRYQRNRYALLAFSQHHLFGAGTGEKTHQPGVWHIRHGIRQNPGRCGAVELRQLFGGRCDRQPIPAGDGIQRRLYQLHHHQERLYDLPVPGGAHLVSGNSNRTITLTSSERTTLLNAMASVKSFTATIELVTKSGNTQIGSASTCTCTIRTSQANSGPSISGFTFVDSYSTTTAITDNDQVLIQDYSRLTVTPGTAAARNGASIVSYSAVCSGVTKSNTTSAALSLGTIDTSGTRDITLTVTDSRGYTASVTQSVTVVPYSKPRVSSVSLRRTNDIETEMQLVFNGSISPITVDGTQKNSLLYARYRYKLTSASSYNSYSSILGSVTATGSSFSFSNLELCNLDSESSYDFHLQIRDN